MTASGRPTPLVATPLVDAVFDLDDLLRREEFVEIEDRVDEGAGDEGGGAG